MQGSDGGLERQAGQARQGQELAQAAGSEDKPAQQAGRHQQAQARDQGAAADA